MKYILALHLVLFCFFDCQSQTKSVEEIYEECYFAAMPNNGQQFKEISKAYETSLIEHGLLKDSSAESYYSLFKQIFTPDFIDDKTDFHFIDSVNTLLYVNLIRANEDCTNRIKSLNQYEKSRTYQLLKRTDSILKNDDIDTEINANAVLNLYNVQDFELDYYKLRVLLMLPDSMPLFNKEKSYSKEQLDTAFKIELIKGDKLVIKSSETSLKEMKVLIKNYLKTKRSTSLIQVSSERDVMYSYYISVVDILNISLKELRNELSLSTFDVTFDQLTPSQKESIEKEYFFELIDKMVD